MRELSAEQLQAVSGGGLWVVGGIHIPPPINTPPILIDNGPVDSGGYTCVPTGTNSVSCTFHPTLKT